MGMHSPKACGNIRSSTAIASVMDHFKIQSARPHLGAGGSIMALPLLAAFDLGFPWSWPLVGFCLGHPLAWPVHSYRIWKFFYIIPEKKIKYCSIWLLYRSDEFSFFNAYLINTRSYNIYLKFWTIIMPF